MLCPRGHFEGLQTLLVIIELRRMIDQHSLHCCYIVSHLRYYLSSIVDIGEFFVNKAHRLRKYYQLILNILEQYSYAVVCHSAVIVGCGDLEYNELLINL